MGYLLRASLLSARGRSHHPRWRVHCQHDYMQWLREIETCKMVGLDGYAYQTAWIHPQDAQKHGIDHGHVMNVFNERGRRPGRRPRHRAHHARGHLRGPRLPVRPHRAGLQLAGSAIPPAEVEAASARASPSRGRALPCRTRYPQVWSDPSSLPPWRPP